MIFMVDYTTTMTKAGQYLSFYLFKYKQILIQRTLDQYKQNFCIHITSKMQITLLNHCLLLIWVRLPSAQAEDLLGWLKDLCEWPKNT